MEKRHGLGKQGLLTASVILAGSLIGMAHADELLLDFGGSWEYLFVEENRIPIDPMTVDPDFNLTWFEESTSGLYDGPAFAAAAPSPIGFSDNVNANLVTNIWNPADLTDIPPAAMDSDGGGTNRLYSAYFRTTLNPTRDVKFLRINGIFDDGAVIYVNGLEVVDADSGERPGRIRVGQDAEDEWGLQATLRTGSEENERFLFVDTLANQPIEIAISLHNTQIPGQAPSGDLFLDVEIESVDSLDSLENDAFDFATNLSQRILRNTTSSVEVEINTSNGDGMSRATRENGEPNHAGVTAAQAGGSVWFLYEPEISQRLYFQLENSSFDGVLAVYTGDAVNALTPVESYRDLTGFPVSATRGSSPFAQGTRVEFDAILGNQYYIAVDGSNALDLGFGTATLKYGNALINLQDPEPGVPDPDPNRINFEDFRVTESLISANSEWSYLLYSDAANQPADPAVVDPDFFGPAATGGWQTTAGYNGPAFLTGTTPLGYGSIDALNDGPDFSAQVPLAQNVWQDRDGTGTNRPPSDTRYTIYFRKAFTPSTATTGLAFRGLIDDGAIIYINGEEVSRLNVAGSANANDWQTLSEFVNIKNLGVSTERFPQYSVVQGINLPAGVEAEIAVSLHQSDSNSSDAVFDLEVFALREAPIVQPPVGDRPIVMISPSATSGQFNLNWAFDPGLTYRVESNPTLESNNWSNVTGVTVSENNGSYSATVTLPSGQDRLFYRVVSEDAAQ